MPITVLSSQDALRNFRQSDVSKWPRRQVDENRFEPVASPAFSTSFSFKPGSTIYTVGSCFARNIEEALEQRGFDIPVRRFWTTNLSHLYPNSTILDNYGVPAIYNEFAWALGEQEFGPEDNLLEVRPGRFADAHLAPRLPLESKEAVMARRQQVFEMTRCVLRADVLVMTLGLVEVWRDNRSGLYLNTRPHQSAMLSDPERFTLHVLDYQEVISFLSRTFALLARHRGDEFKAVLTVSPVPMSSTYTGQDVAVANQYSKSVLRAAAQEIASGSERIDYFPSYESIVLSEREIAYEDDQVHVRQELIDHNVTRMIAAYTGEPVAGEAFKRAQAFPTAQVQSDFRRLRAYMAEKDFVRAIAMATLLEGTRLYPDAVRMQAMAMQESGDLLAAETKAREAIALREGHGVSHGTLGRILFQQGRYDEAAASLNMALDLSPDAPMWAHLLVQTYLKLNRVDDARTAAEHAMVAHPENDQVQRLQALVERHAQRGARRRA